MDTITNLKEQTVAETPLVLFDVELPDGETKHWATHGVTVDTQAYEARVLGHDLFEIESASEQGVDAIPRIRVRVANADSVISQLDASPGIKGSKITATFLFYDLPQGQPASEKLVVFRGVLNPPDEIRDGVVRLSAINRMNMQRVLLPPVRIQRRCPWSFPSTAAERAEAVDGGAEGIYSRFFACGYSADQTGGAGNLNGAEPFTSCAFTREACVARGMFDSDASSAPTRRFGGIEFVPPQILVRPQGSRERIVSPVVDNEARYNDFVPLIYGSQWVQPPVVFARNDGNLTRMEVLVGAGELERVVTVLVNDVEIPAAVSGSDMTGSGWWKLFASGARTGGFNENFTAPDGSPLGDPYGSMACLSVVVPNQIYNGASLPRVSVLAEGLKLESFDTSGAPLGSGFSKNPVWVLLDVLRRSGWLLSEIDLPSFADAAAFCDETIAATDNQGNSISIERFQCNLTVRSRRTAADVIRGIRNCARLQLHYRSDGKLAVFVENSLQLQQPVKPEGSNATEELNGGWPAYIYSDGTTVGIRSAILRRADGSPSIRLWSRPIADTPNRFSIEFSDHFNAYQQDSLAVVDAGDIARTGQEISGRLIVDGLPTFDQAARILKFFLDKAIQGNRFIEFETTVKAMHQKAGDIIAVTYLQEGLVDQPFRIVRIEPSTNYRFVRITAQMHNDAWYQDTNGQLSLIPATRRLPGPESGRPAPLVGDSTDSFGDPQFSIAEYQLQGTDGGILTEIEVGFEPPSAGQSLKAGIPLVNLQPNVFDSGGTLAAGQTLYYAVTAVDGDGNESNRSFVVRAVIPAGPDTNRVELTGLSFTSETVSFHVYRGNLPSRLLRIAEAQPLAASFTDTGLAADLTGAPDPNYDHANFYWRLEETEEQFASIFSADSVGSDQLAMTPDTLAGHAARLIRGKGAGQERTVTSNTDTTLFVAPEWEITPDESTVFVVSENTWRFGGRARTSPARFEIPNRRDRVAQITGRAANAQNVESLEGLALVTRWRIGGGGLGVADFAAPPEPVFGVSARGDGMLELSAIGFPTLENTQSIASGTFRFKYRDELNGASSTVLAAAVSDTDTSLSLNQAGGAEAGSFIQIGNEVMRVDEVQSAGTVYVVTRGACESTAAAHADGAEVHHLRERSEGVAFEPSFFGTAISGDWSHGVWLPNVRLACAEFWVTNAFGQSPVAVNNFSAFPGGGLRTLRGGQFNFQIEGVLGVKDDATPPLSIQEDLTIRDVFAHVKQAPEGADLQVRLTQDGVELTTLTIPGGQTASAAVDGAALAVLQSGGLLRLDVTAVGTAYPGRDLAVTIRV